MKNSVVAGKIVLVLLMMTFYPASSQDSINTHHITISGQDSSAIARQLSEVYRTFRTTEEENEFLALFHDTPDTYIRADFHASPLLNKEKATPEEYFRKLNYLGDFYRVTNRQDTIGWKGSVWYRDSVYYSYFTFSESVEEYDYPIARGRVVKSARYEKMAIARLYRDTLDGFFNRARLIAIDAIRPDSIHLYDSIRLHIDQEQRFIAFDTTSSDTLYYNFETRKLPHRIIVNTNVDRPGATFSLFARYIRNGRTIVVPLKRNVSPTATDDQFYDLKVIFDLEEIPEQLIAMNRSGQNQPYRLEVQWDQNISIRRISEKSYYFTRLLNFNRQSMADVYRAGEIVPKLSVADDRGEVFCYEASFHNSSRSVGVRGRSPVAPVYKVDYFMDPNTSLFDEIGEASFSGQILLMESVKKNGTFVPVTDDQFRVIFKKTKGNGNPYTDGKFTIDRDHRKPNIIFDLKPLIESIKALPGEPYPDKYYRFRITLQNDSLDFAETTETPAFRINPPVRIPEDYHLLDRFFSNERKLLIADRDSLFRRYRRNFEKRRKSVEITVPPNRHIADFDRQAQLSIRVRNLSKYDKLLLKACSGDECFTIREIELYNKYPATYETNIRLFGKGSESVKRFDRFRKGTSNFLFENELYFKIEMADIRRIDMPMLGYKSSDPTYADNCRDNSFVNKKYEKQWRDWEENNPAMTYEIISDSTAEKYRIYPWLEVEEEETAIKNYIRKESRKKSNSVPLKFTMRFPKTEPGRRVRNVGVIAAVYYPDFTIRNVLLDVIEVNDDKIVYEKNLVEKISDLNLGERLNLNIWLVDNDQSVFNPNPAKMKWGKRIELVLKETRLR